MAQYSHVTIINGTPNDFIRGPHHSYQMDDWDSAFPDKISSGDSARIQLGFQNPFLRNKHNDEAEQTYSLANASGSFTLQARSPDDGYHLWLDASTMGRQTPQGDSKARVDMGWKEDSELTIWIAGTSDAVIIRTWWSGDEA
jgi:hypothetical protein